MRVLFTVNGWEEYQSWCSPGTTKSLLRINALINDIRRHPFEGIGKPEPLKGNLKGLWSRRISGEHRLVYHVSDKDAEQIVTIVMCRHHY